MTDGRTPFDIHADTHADTPAGQVAWEAANGRYLSAALDWLRLLLGQYIAASRPPDPPAVPTAAPVVAPEPRPDPDPDPWWRFPLGLRTKTRPVAGEALAGEALVSEAITDERVAAAAEKMSQAERDAVRPPALVSLAQRLGLSRFERDTLLLCVAAELDPSFGGLLAAAHGNERMPHPSFGLALTLLPDPAWDALSPVRPLRYWRLVEITRHAGQPLVTSLLQVEERIVNHVKGLDYLDDQLDHMVTRLDADTGPPLPPSQRAVVDEIVGKWWRTPGSGPVIQLVGASETSKRLIAGHAAAERGLMAYRLPATMLPDQTGDLVGLARLWQREAMLLPLALYLDVEDAGTGGEIRPPVSRFLGRVDCPTFVASRDSWPDLGGPSTVLDVEPPTAVERAAAWDEELGGTASAAQTDALAGQFALDLPAIREVAAVAGDRPDAAWHACSIRNRPRLDTLAERLTSRVSWDDIVLPEDGQRLLKEIADQVAHRTRVYDTWGFGDRISRGKGLSTLFAGPSGVGKTMAAEVLANHLGLDLYLVDLSAVVSKYIGETEKNLRRCFDAAEGVATILCFDEADALFGKRSEVKDSHDRYANFEISYLLQRMEAYQGLAILTTNMRTALDTAFLRRLRYIVEFPFPGPAERRAIWEKAFPAAAPRADLDYDRLAELQVSGGVTRNIALNAAFLAAAAGTEITMPLVLRAARTEFHKLDMPIRERDFVWTGREPSP